MHVAGDWIKVEHATLDKPEVTLFAELLGVAVDHGFGILVRFWMWIDRNSRNGVVTHVSRKSIDTIMHCPGFSGAIEAVKWLEFDDEKRTATVPNFDRHNGSSAKTRGLVNARVQRFRNAKSNDSVTQSALPEKRRVSTTIHPLNSDTPARPPVDKSTPGHKNGLKGKDEPRSGAWRRDPDAAERKARSLGIKSRPGESTEELVHRIDQFEERQRSASA